MVTVKLGDLFDSQAQTLVNTVNCVGIMGKGIALEFKKRFPDMYEDYVQRCARREVRLGEPYFFRRLMLPSIINFPTKDHWRAVSRLEDIEAGLRHLESHYKDWGITSLAVPPLGCGHGHLEWRVVGPTLYRHLKRLEIPVDLYAPFGTPHEELNPKFLDLFEHAEASQPGLHAQDRIGAAWIALVEILRKIDQEPYHWPVGRTTFQKIAYFATQTGVPTGLQFKRGSFGPFSAELKSRIAALANNGLVREEQLGRMFAVKVGQTFDDARRLYQPQIDQWSQAIDKVADLFMRMQTNQAEIAATVHFVMCELRERGSKPTEMDIYREALQWKQKRRPPLNEHALASAIRSLNILSWLEAKVSEDLPVDEKEQASA